MSSKRWVRAAVAATVIVLFLGITIGFFGLKRMAAGAATLSSWQKNATQLGLTLEFKELTPPDLKANAAQAYSDGRYAAAARMPTCWFDLADVSAREFREFQPLWKAFEALAESDRAAALKVLAHASAIPFRETYLIRLKAEKQLLSTAPKGTKADLIRKLGPLIHPRTALRGELARDRARLERKWKDNAPVDFLLAKDVAEARLIELWSTHFDSISKSETPEQVEVALARLDAAIEGRRVIGRFMRTGYGEVGKLYREVAELRESP